jgi:hypothetical protein
MLNSAKAKVDKEVAMECHRLQQKIHKIHVAMDVLVYGAEKITTLTGR